MNRRVDDLIDEDDDVDANVDDDDKNDDDVKPLLVVADAIDTDVRIATRVTGVNA